VSLSTQTHTNDAISHGAAIVQSITYSLNGCCGSVEIIGSAEQ